MTNSIRPEAPIANGSRKPVGSSTTISVGISDEDRNRGNMRNAWGWLKLAGVLALIAYMYGTLPVAYAIDNPTTIQILTVRCYQSVIESSDTLCVTHYSVSYPGGSLPSESITDAYLGRFLSGTQEINSVAPVAYSASTLTATTSTPAGGYGEGILSHYWAAGQAVTDGLTFAGAGYSVVLQGNPSVFTTSTPSTQFNSIDWVSSQVPFTLASHIREITTSLENVWSDNAIILMTTLQTEIVFTAAGESYILKAIPNLALMAPSIFTTQLRAPIVGDLNLTPSIGQGYETFWVGSALENGFDSWASFLGLSAHPMVARSILTVIFMVVLGGTAVRITGFVGAWFPVSVGMVLPSMVLIGLVPWALAIIAGFLCVVAIAFQYLYSRQ